MGLLSGIGNILGIGESSTKYARKAGEADIAMQREGLDYLKSVQAPVLARREAAAEPLMGFYTDPAQRAQFYQEAEQDPTLDYLSGLGEESLLRTAAATGYGGGLRGSGTGAEMARIRPEIVQNLVNQRLQGLQGFAQMPIDSGQIAQQYSNIGASEAGKYQAIGQAKQDKYGNILGLGTKIAGLF